MASKNIVKCSGKTQTGAACKRNATANGYCGAHKDFGKNKDKPSTTTVPPVQTPVKKPEPEKKLEPVKKPEPEKKPNNKPTVSSDTDTDTDSDSDTDTDSNSDTDGMAKFLKKLKQKTKEYEDKEKEKLSDSEKKRMAEDRKRMDEADKMLLTRIPDPEPVSKELKAKIEKQIAEIEIREKEAREKERKARLERASYSNKISYEESEGRMSLADCTKKREEMIKNNSVMDFRTQLAVDRHYAIQVAMTLTTEENNKLHTAVTTDYEERKQMTEHLKMLSMIPESKGRFNALVKEFRESSQMLEKKPYTAEEDKEETERIKKIVMANPLKYQYNSYDDLGGIRLPWIWSDVYDRFGQYDIDGKLLLTCKCAGCSLDKTDGHKQYTNFHCKHCSCIKCVCLGRKSMGKYRRTIMLPFNYNPCKGKCRICKRFNHDDMLSKFERTKQV